MAKGPMRSEVRSNAMMGWSKRIAEMLSFCFIKNSLFAFILTIYLLCKKFLLKNRNPFTIKKI